MSFLHPNPKDIVKANNKKVVVTATDALPDFWNDNRVNAIDSVRFINNKGKSKTNTLVNNEKDIRLTSKQESC